MPRDFEELAFTIENEEWNEYELKDGSTIRGRAILTKVTRDPYNPANYGFDTAPPIWSVQAPMASRGEPNVQQGQNIVGAKYEVHVNRNHEPWNVYRILKTGQKLKIKLSITEVSRFVGKFDAKGMPVYDLPNGISVTVSPPESDTGQ